MTFTKEESLIFERIEREFAERQASDARLQSLLADLHGAFNAAIKIARGDTSEKVPRRGICPRTSPRGARPLRHYRPARPRSVPGHRCLRAPVRQ